MSRAAPATAVRVLGQLRHDPRTVGLIIVVPSGFLALLRYSLSGRLGTFQSVGAPLVGLFPLVMMFLVTSITMLRERTSGTLERLMTLPLSKLDLMTGYGIAFAIVAAAQGSVVAAVGFGLLGLHSDHGTALVIGLAVANAVVGTSLGLFVSAFARTEFQAVQFMPAFVFPQLLLCGLVVPRAQMAGALQVVARYLPLTYAFDALGRAARSTRLGSGMRTDLVAMTLTALVALFLGALTLPRRTA